MKEQRATGDKGLKAKGKGQRAKDETLINRKDGRLLFVCLLSFIFCLFLFLNHSPLALSLLPSFAFSPLLSVDTAAAAEKWQGVDESVVEKYAKEQGREARKPLINTDQGDLLLFVFLVAGTAAGFAAGYFWRILMVEKAPSKVNKEKKII